MNILLGIISVLITFSSVVLVDKFFKREGLYVWISISVITANILVCKNIDILGFTSNLGIVMFASIFLATDIMSEKYSCKDSRRAVILAVISQVFFMIAMSLAIAYTPSSVDLSNDNMKALFSINVRVSIASITMFLASNMLDIYLFEKIKKKLPNQLWIRNNVATIISNCLENYFFIFFAFVGIYDLKTILTIATVGSLLEMTVAVMDTPFIYLSKKLK